MRDLSQPRLTHFFPFLLAASEDNWEAQDFEDSEEAALADAVDTLERAMQDSKSSSAPGSLRKQIGEATLTHSFYGSLCLTKGRPPSSPPSPPGLPWQLHGTSCYFSWGLLGPLSLAYDYPEPSQRALHKLAHHILVSW